MRYASNLGKASPKKGLRFVVGRAIPSICQLRIP
jgi:hypothetical protein